MTFYYRQEDPYIPIYCGKEYRERDSDDPSFWKRRDQSQPILINTTDRSFTVSQIKTWHKNTEADVIRDVSLNITVGIKTSLPGFVCGFVDHKNKDLQEWRREINKPFANITMREMIRILKRFFGALIYALNCKLKELYERYEYSRY